MPAKDVDEYLAAVSEPARSALVDLRRAIKAACPEAEEAISYGVPGYKYHGMLVSFGAAKNHCSFYPGSILDDFKEEVSAYSTSRGTVRFTPEKPLPADLVTRIVKARMAQNKAARPGKR